MKLPEPFTHQPTPIPGEPIAVVGMACRLPGAANPGQFWQLLREGADAITEAPEGRWEGVTLPYRRGGFLDRVDEFDPGFFGIAPREAAMMDPQQRLVLELSWEALEDARIVPADLRDTDTGVFIGAIWDDYATLVHRNGIESVGQYAVTGSHRSIIANRVSYVLGVHGPSLTVDTGQSSSLVAVHMACESLRSGESTAAIVGGVNLNILAESTVGTIRFGGLSPDGRCFTFDARANGYVRGEGSGVVVLKPLSSARAAGDRIYCVLAGSAVNNDGSTAGLTVPSAPAQAKVVRLACERAAVDPGDVQYVELHGTATRVGDPVEAAALGAAFGKSRAAGSPLLVGSAKTNVGHLEGAAGIVGLLKVALSIAHREIPPSLNYDTPNPDIPLDDLGIQVQRTLGRWPDADRTLVAGVSSFGMGGTNCHVIVAEPPRPAEPADQPSSGTDNDARPSRVVPWVLSAKTPQALRTQAQHLLRHVLEHPDLDPADIAHSLATTRSAFRFGAACTGRDIDSLTAGLDAIAAGRNAGMLQSPASDGAVACLFPGQGRSRSAWDGCCTRRRRPLPAPSTRSARK
ncbi:type I polyketide synthase [Dactylosporangium cerinum]